ncbi:hypothetical protein L9F63_026845, partial [Diploptera punctata]
DKIQRGNKSICPSMGAAGAGVPLGAVLASSPSHRAGSYEAEDAIYRGGGSTTSRGRSGLYYSPPGTSYTIVERPTTAPTPGKHPRGTYLGSSTTFNNTRANHHHHHHPGTNGKKRPISPEQVLRMFGTAGPPVGSNKMPGGRRSAVSSPASSPHNLNMHQDLVVRTVNMVRPPDSTHGFGICVKGGKDSGVGVYISRVEEGSVAERAGLRPGDTILEVNGTPFSTISHEEALKEHEGADQILQSERHVTHMFRFTTYFTAVFDAFEPILPLRDLSATRSFSHPTNSNISCTLNQMSDNTHPIVIGVTIAPFYWRHHKWRIKCWKCCPPAVKQALYRVNTFRLTRFLPMYLGSEGAIPALITLSSNTSLIFVRHKIVDCRSGRSKLTSSRTSGWQSEMRTRRERYLTGETP